MGFGKLVVRDMESGGICDCFVFLFPWGKGCVGCGWAVWKKGRKLTFLYDGVEVGESFELGDSGWFAGWVWYCFDEFVVEAFVDGRVADDAVACCDQGVFDGINAAACDAESLVLEVV